ncbi:MAG: hypothetical protein QXH91_09440, partial [Candidatus Bathyarchaeia archaeon]
LFKYELNTFRLGIPILLIPILLIKIKPKEYSKAEKIQQIIKAEIMPILLMFVGKPWIATAKVAR